MPVALALGPESVLLPGLHAFGVLDERTQLGEVRLRERRVRGQLVVPAAGGLELAPRRPRCRPARELLLPAETVEHLELVGRTREPPLLELTRHRDQALDGGGDVLARGRTSPGIRTRTPVAEHSTGDDERTLVLGPQLCELLEIVGEVELRLDICLLGGRTDVRVVALRPEQEPERLSEDRLPGARLPRDRIQPGCQLELGLANEDEVLDAEPPEHAAIVDPQPDAAHCLFETRLGN